MLQAFKDYVSNYDLNKEEIKLKYNHSIRVMELNRKYAKILGFSDHDIELATVIGLLHDIGRFEQLKVYNTFNDSKSIDHASYGVEQLFEKNLIKKFWKNEKDYEIIKLAIENHNKFKIPDIKDERILKHVKLIRDIDKIDILYLLGYLGELNIKATNDIISSEIINSIKNHESILLKYIKNSNDNIAIKFAYAFDVNYDVCLEEVKRNLKYFYKQIDDEKNFKKIYLEVIKYIDERIGNSVRNKI